MRRLLLRRTENTSDGVFGVLFGVAPSPMVFHTMEEDWKGNARRVSCIPAGVYEIHRTWYHKHNYETFEIADVPGRTRILLHTANSEEDVEGCVGIGLRRGFIKVKDEDDPRHPLVSKRAVLESKKAFELFMHCMDDVDEAILTVEWADGVEY